MAAVRAAAHTALGFVQEAKSSDIMTVPGFLATDSGVSLRIDTGGTILNLAVQGNTTLSISPTTIAAITGVTFSGDGSTLTNLPPNQFSSLLQVPVGGTGRLSFTSNGVVLGSGTNPLSVSSAGLADQVFTSRGTGLDGLYADPITGTSGYTVMSGVTFAITSATFQDPSLFVDLPSAGRYWVGAEVRSDLVMSSGAGIISLKLYNSTDSVDIPNTVRIGANTTSSGNFFIASTVCSASIFVSAAKRIKLLCNRTGGGSFSTCQLTNDTGSGQTVIYFMKTGRV